MASAPAVSVVVPVFNAAAFVDGAIGSALAQSLADIEVIAVDDGSSDQSRARLDDIARGDARVRVFGLAANQGPGAARNAGIEQARGEYIFFLDADDFLPPFALQHLLAAARQAQCELAIGKLLWHREQADVGSLEYASQAGAVEVADFKESSYLQGIPGCHCCNLYRRELLNRSGIRYDVGLSYGEDQLFQATAMAAAGRVALLDEIVYVYHHYRSQSATRKPPTLANLLDDIAFHEKTAALFARQDLTQAAHRFLLGTWSYSIREYWLRIPESLSADEANAFFAAFRAMVARSGGKPWNERTPAHHRHLLELVLASRDDDAYRFLATDEARRPQ